MTIRAPMVVVTAAALLAGYPVVGLSDGAEEATAAITGGTFVMGAEVEDDHRPPHEVSVGDFLMDRREVTTPNTPSSVGRPDVISPSSGASTNSKAVPGIPTTRSWGSPGTTPGRSANGGACVFPPRPSGSSPHVVASRAKSGPG